MNKNKTRRSKKGVSEMISYVILITIAIGLAIAVFTWLRYSAGIVEDPDCKDGTSLVINDYSCLKDFSDLNDPGIQLTIKNNGYFNISGFVVSVSNDSNKDTGYNIYDNYGTKNLMAGYYFFTPQLNPGDEQSITFSYNISSSESLNKFESIVIQPFIVNENKKRIFCMNAVIKQKLEDCNFAGLTYKFGLFKSCTNNIDCSTNYCASTSILGKICQIPGTVSWWKLNGDAQDSIGTNHGTIFGSTTTYTAGIKGSANEALGFDGSSNYIETPINTIPPEGFTFTAWINTSNKDWQSIISKGSYNDSYYFYLNDRNNLSIIFNDSTTYIVHNYSREDEIPLKNWKFVAVTYNSSTKYIYLYVNGNFDKTFSYNAVDIKDSNYNILIGTALNPLTHSPDKFFQGSMSNVMIFNRPLNKNEIVNIYNAQSRL